MVQIDTIIEKLNLLFSIGDYENAQKLLESARKVPELYNDTVAIYDATISLNNGDYPQMWEAIRRGLEYNPQNYELYIMLGEYYLPTNPDQAYLCFEQALFYCDNETDSVQIQSLVESLKTQHNISVRNISFILLSYNCLKNTKSCLDSIKTTTPASCREIIVVDNASTDGSIEWLKQQSDIILCENKEDIGFIKGYNKGASLTSKENDIYLLNSDTFLPPNAIFWLRMGLYENHKIGSVGSITNYASNMYNFSFRGSSLEDYLDFATKHNLPQQYPYEEKLFLIGFPLLLKRAVFDLIGNLDEQFGSGTFEDNDYGLRILQKGYKNILCHNSFIVHFGLESFKKDIDLMDTNKKTFKEKWGIDPNYYFSPRSELVDYVIEEKETPMNILEIGCGCCATSLFLKGKYPNSTLYGVEIVPKAADLAKYVSDVICADIETLEFPWEEDFFDYVIMGDVLEHLREPSLVLKKLHKYVKKGGHIIISMPNVKHYSVMLPLLMHDEFTYEDAGILDTTHLKMYTGKEIIRLVENSAYTIESINSLQLAPPSEEEEKVIEHLMSISASKNKTEYLTYQYVVKAQK